MSFFLLSPIAGNGPSGISLSYMLAGNWPYWSPDKIQRHPDELLRARLNYYDSQKSLVEHDLFSLADGLEGRSTNPVSLLVSDQCSAHENHTGPFSIAIHIYNLLFSFPTFSLTVCSIHALTLAWNYPAWWNTNPTRRRK